MPFVFRRICLATVICLGGSLCVTASKGEQGPGSVVPVELIIPLGSIERDLIQEAVKERPEGQRHLPYLSWKHGNQLIKDIPTNVETLVPHTVIVKETFETTRKVAKTVRSLVPEKRQVALGLLFPVFFFNTVMVEKVSEIMVDEVVPIVRDVEKTVMKPIRSLTSLDVDLAYDVDLNSLSVSSEQGLIKVVAKLGVDLDATLVKAGPLPVGLTASQDVQAVVTATRKPQWTPDGRLEFVGGDAQVDWSLGGLLSAFDYDFTYVLNKQLLKLVADRLLDDALSDRLGTLNPLSDRIDDLVKPLALGHSGDLWLAIKARELILAPWSVDAEVRSTVYLVGAPALTSGEEPPPEAAPARRRLEPQEAPPSPRLEIHAILEDGWMSAKFKDLAGESFAFLAPRVEARQKSLGLTFGGDGGVELETAIDVETSPDGLNLVVKRVAPVTAQPQTLVSYFLGKAAEKALDAIPSIDAIGRVKTALAEAQKKTPGLTISSEAEKLSGVTATPEGLVGTITGKLGLSYTH